MKMKVFAHRGASAYAPENTLEAFDQAVEMGADGIELDVHICKSGELVVTHDETVERVSNGFGWVKDLTLSELKGLQFNKTHPEFQTARIPTLQEVFQRLRPTRISLNIELKNSLIDYPDLERKVIELADREGMTDRVLFSSFNHQSMLRVKAIRPELFCGLLYEASLVKPWAYAVALGMDAIHPHYSAVITPGGACLDAHKAGIAVNTWTVNTNEDITKVIREGVDILITNKPDLAIACASNMRNA
ncbi:MAG: glycerophosphodiester phosphodiesterase [Clostridia bacterium]|nr:glycerophosphodiester phosphodiesterase [Clostridia bacterium]